MEGPEKTCETCRHFHRHYVRMSRNSYFPLKAGHCGEPRCRDKAIDTPACRRYSKRKTGSSGESL